MTYENALNVFTDGSSLERPRRGGIGIRYVLITDGGDEEWRDECPTGYKQATNNEMELMACILALRGIPPRMMADNVERIVIFTDSLYVRDHLRHAMKVWPANGWCNRHGRPIENVKLWKDLVREVRTAPRRVVVEWVRGHARNRHNKAADRLARRSANGFLNEPLTVRSVSRKLSGESVEIGSVRMAGQEADIRIITDQRMPEQKLWRYKYEVLSPDSRYAGKVDVIFSPILLHAHRSYRVRLGDNPKNPRIVALIHEIAGSGDGRGY